ncbi:MAG: efflux transporter outer membrane subunit [Alphaproteobacteria bacterium]
MIKLNFLFSLLFLLQACTITSEFNDPQINTPKSWVKSNEEIKQLENKKSQNWWQSFNDPLLESLINEALIANSDIQLAINNITKAQAAIAASSSDRLPSLDLKASGSRTQNSPQVPSPMGNKPINSFTVGGNISYQLDLFGKLANANKSAKSELLAAETTKDNVRLTIASEVAKAYFNIISLSEQINLTKEVIEFQKQLFEIVQAKYNSGIIDRQKFLNAELNLNTIITKLPSLEQQLSEQDNAIKILLGRDPESFTKNIIEHTDKINNLPATPIIPNLIPSRLLAQRPDIKAAEYKLASANAQIDIARAAYFPDISLTSLIGAGSVDIDKLFTNSNTWNIAGSLTAPIFNFGKTRASVKIAEATRSDYLTKYHTAVRTAFAEVFNALTAQENNFAIYEKIKRNELSEEEAQSISQSRYDVGYTDLSEVFSVKQNLLNAKIVTIKSYQNCLNSSVDLFKALGGYWDAP